MLTLCFSTSCFPRHALGVARSPAASQLIQTPDEKPEHVINEVNAPDDIETTPQQLVSAKSMEDDLEVSDEEETEGEESERCALALVKSEIHHKVCAERLETQFETQGQVECLARSVAEAVESVKSLRELVQKSNAMEESLLERVETLEHTVEELSMAADHDNQMYVEVIQLAKQLDKVQKMSKENQETLQNHVQCHHKQEAAMKGRTGELSQTCRANKKDTSALSLKDMVQIDQGEQIEELCNRVEHLEDMSHRVERLVRAATESKTFGKRLDALERRAAANERTSLDGRTDRLEANVTDMHDYESLLSRLVLLGEGTAASNKKAEELAMATLNIGKASAERSSFDSLVQSVKEISEKVDLIQSARSSVVANKQGASQHEKIQDLELKAGLQAKMLETFKNEIVTLQQTSKQERAIIRELSFDSSFRGRALNSDQFNH